MRLKANIRDKHPAGAEMPPEKPCAVRLSEGKSVTSAVGFSPGISVPVRRSACAGLLRHSAANSTSVSRRPGTVCRTACKPLTASAHCETQFAALRRSAALRCGNTGIERCLCNRYRTWDSCSPAANIHIPFYNVVVGAQGSNQLFYPLLFPACQFTVLDWHWSFLLSCCRK